MTCMSVAEGVLGSYTPSHRTSFFRANKKTATDYVDSSVVTMSFRGRLTRTLPAVAFLLVRNPVYATDEVSR